MAEEVYESMENDTAIGSAEVDIHESAIKNCSLLESHEREETVHDSKTDALFYSFLAAQVIVGAIGWLGNALLFYGQIRTYNWPFYQRYLFFNVTIAAMITSAIHCTQGVVQLIKFHSTGDGELGDSEWSDIGGDSAHVAVAFGLMMLAFQNLYALRVCSKSPESSVQDDSKRGRLRRGFTVAAMIVGVWTLAVACIAGGLNPHAEAGSDGQEPLAYVSYAVHLATQACVAVAIVITRRLARRLEIDFSVRRALHSLKTRQHVKETINLTSAITRVLILHIITWVASFTVAFLVNYLAIAEREAQESSAEVESGESDLCKGRVESSAEVLEEENQMAAYIGIVDFLALCFEALYPFVLAWKQSRIQRVILYLVTCHRKHASVAPSLHVSKILASTSADSIARRGTITVNNGARTHHDAIDHHWRMVVTDKVEQEKRSPKLSRKT